MHCNSQLMWIYNRENSTPEYDRVWEHAECHQLEMTSPSLHCETAVALHNHVFKSSSSSPAIPTPSCQFTCPICLFSHPVAAIPSNIPAPNLNFQRSTGSNACVGRYPSCNSRKGLACENSTSFYTFATNTCWDRRSSSISCYCLGTSSQT